MKKLFLLTLWLSSFFAIAQQNGVISGKITDARDAFSLPGATIMLDFQDRYTISDTNGSFQFLHVPEGTYQISVDYMGYQSYIQKVTVKKGENTVINFALKAEDIHLQEVVIVGDFLKGQAKALNQQKNRQNISNIISADQVGRFPDSNIGDALKRVAGITMQNDQGEARNIIIRGLAPNLNSVALDGDRIPSAEGDNRNVQMDLIPSDMIASIEVNKTLTSDMDADAIGGSVNLVTRATPNKERISATLAGGYAPIRHGANTTLGLVYGNRFFDDRLGVILSASYNDNHFGSDNVEAIWKKWEKNGNMLEYVEQMDIRKYDVQRTRRSFSTTFDYKINENNSLSIKGIYNWRDDRETRFRSRVRGVTPTFSGATFTGFTGDIRNQTKAGADNHRNKQARLEDQRVQNYALSGDHLLGSSVDLQWGVNYALASEDRPDERYIEFHNRKQKLTFNGSENKPLYTVNGKNSPEKYALRKLTSNHNYTQEEEIGFKLNLRFPFSVIENQKGRIRTGVRFKLKEKSRDNIFYEHKEIAGVVKTLNDVKTTFLDGKNWQVGEQYVAGTFAQIDYLSTLDLENPTLFSTKDVPAEYLNLNYNAKENIYATYLRWDQDFSNRFSMIAGVRVEKTDINYTGNHVLNETTLAGKISNKNDYVNFLPSVAFKYDLKKDFIWRVAFSTALARPDYYALAPYVSVFSADNKIFAGNPKLKATYSYNFDVMAEKYFKSVGILSGGIFYKHLNNFIYTYIANNTYSHEQFAREFPNVANPIDVGADHWSFKQQRNGENVAVYGFELAAQRQLDFLPSKFFKGFGAYVNYTYTQSKAQGITNNQGEKRDGLGLPATAPHMLNASLSWENKGLLARISINHTSDYLDELGGNPFEDRYYDQQTFLDFNASYKATKNMSIFLEANNLTNQPLRYYQGISARTMQVEYYRPKYNIGIKLDF